MLHISTNETPDIVGLTETIKDSMSKGIKIADNSSLLHLVEGGIKKFSKELVENYGISNPNSRAQIITAFERLSKTTTPDIYDICYDKRTGKWSTKAENLSELALVGVRIAVVLSGYRTLNNIASTITSLNTLRDKNNLVHPEVTVGKTGRFNYKNPALMNINKKVLWNLIEARDYDSTLYSVDIKNQEPWILINMLNIGSLVGLLDSGKSIYDSVYRMWYGSDFENKTERNEFKAAWNALTYGGSKYTVNNICKHISSDIIYTNFKKIAELKEYNQKCVSNGYRGTRECETIFHRKLDCDAAKGMALGRQLMDYPIQGSGVDILSFLNNNLLANAHDYGYEEMIEPYMFRHDEIVVQISNSLIEFVGEKGIIDFLQDTFKHKVDDWEPFSVDIKEVRPKEMSLDEILDIE